MSNIIYFILAAFFEITGCYLFWTYFRAGKSALLLIPALTCLLAFAYLLTKIDTASAGRAYAAYGGIYITCSLLWMYKVENFSPDSWDFIGAGICLIGTLVILFAPR
ncbi:MAG: YnfA family protein [Cytophaga sp.]|uniref:YnfA family protein n=1 Tax=Cytophaga sp. TaxID=29535 RepID=UPI003F806BA2